MYEYATLDDFRRWRGKMLSEECASIVRNAESNSASGSTFLSHSTKDQEFLPPVIRLLENHGASVYVDKKDEALPPFTSRKTAKILRSRIVEYKKFVLFATRTSKNSRWMPWELGISDGVKRSSNTAILSGLDKAGDTEWAEQEYLGVYDRIVWGDLQGEPKKVWMALNQEKNTATKLRSWLAT